MALSAVYQATVSGAGGAQNTPAPGQHRFSYEHFVGSIPDGLTLDHTCHRRATCQGGPTCLHRRCVNPAHLEAVPQGVNTERGWCLQRIRRITINVGGVDVQICKNGHWITPENRFTTTSGFVGCLGCRRMHAQRTA